MQNKMFDLDWLGVVWLVLIPLVLFIIAIISFVTIPSGFVGVKSTFGKIDTNELQPGAHIIMPFITKVEKVNVKVKSITYKRNRVTTKEQEWIIYKPAITVLDSRGLPINIELTVLYRLLPDKAAETLIKYWKSWDEKLINPTIREVVRDVLWSYKAEEMPEKRQEIATKIKDELLKRFKKSDIQITNIQLRNIKLPITVEKKILQVQEAKQEAEKQKYLLEKAKVEAQTKVAQAKGEADAKIEAAKGEAESIKVKAQAQAEANKKLSNSITPELIKYEYVKKWNGKTPSTVVWDKWNILLNLK